MVVRRDQIRRIRWVIKKLEAQVGQFLLGCKWPVSRSIVVQDPLGDLTAAGVFPSKCPSVTPAEMNNTPRWLFGPLEGNQWGGCRLDPKKSRRELFQRILAFGILFVIFTAYVAPHLRWRVVVFSRCRPVFNPRVVSVVGFLGRKVTMEHVFLLVLCFCLSVYATSPPYSFVLTDTVDAILWHKRGSRGSSVSIVTGLRAGQPRDHGSITSMGKSYFCFPNSPDRLWDPQSPIRLLPWDTPPGVRRPECEYYHFPPSSA